VRADVVVVVPPERQHPTSRADALEDLLVQKFIAQAPVERLDEGVLLWLTRLDVMPGDAGLVLPLEDRAAGQLAGKRCADRT
jgi:hypothetical protein